MELNLKNEEDIKLFQQDVIFGKISTITQATLHYLSEVELRLMSISSKSGDKTVYEDLQGAYPVYLTIPEMFHQTRGIFDFGSARNISGQIKRFLLTSDMKSFNFSGKLVTIETRNTIYSFTIEED